MKEKYDSTKDTNDHIDRVRDLLIEVVDKLIVRASVHDRSKLEKTEKNAFDGCASKLKKSTYGSLKYMQSLDEMKSALDHHYANNSHHPQHYVDGVDGMNWFDLIEMLCDWKAAGERHADGSMTKSLEVCQVRFKIKKQLQSILENTARDMGWL